MKSRVRVWNWDEVNRLQEQSISDIQGMREWEYVHLSEVLDLR
jgi:hypothetical protein